MVIIATFSRAVIQKQRVSRNLSFDWAKGGRNENKGDNRRLHLVENASCTSIKLKWRQRESERERDCQLNYYFFVKTP